jgi:fibronectin type 3 domain-containing protein
MTPTIPDQVVNVFLFKFWEGATKVKGVVENKNVDGIGFAELVASHSTEILTPSIPQGLTVSAYPDHNTIRWEASTPGTYPLGGYRVYRSNSDDGHWKYIASTTDLFYHDYSATQDSAFFYTVSSFDNQSSTSASNYAGPIPVEIKDFQSTINAIKIHPNPADGLFSIECSEKEKFEIKLYTLTGKLAIQKNLSGQENKIDISSLPNDIYMVVIISVNGIRHQKLIKN